jgi:hypothetical protein
VRLTVRTPPVDYDSPVWKFHRHVSFAVWALVGAGIASWTVGAAQRHSLSRPTAYLILEGLVLMAVPPHQGHHWITYRRPTLLLFPLTAAWYVFGVLPVPSRVNRLEARLRHLLGFRSELPGTLLALAWWIGGPAYLITGVLLSAGR